MRSFLEVHSYGILFLSITTAKYYHITGYIWKSFIFEFFKEYDFYKNKPLQNLNQSSQLIQIPLAILLPVSCGLVTTVTIYKHCVNHYVLLKISSKFQGKLPDSNATAWISLYTKSPFITVYFHVCPLLDLWCKLINAHSKLLAVIDHVDPTKIQR